MYADGPFDKWIPFDGRWTLELMKFSAPPDGQVDFRKYFNLGEKSRSRHGG